MLTAWLLFLVFLLLILANALFVAVEFSFLTIDRQAVQRAEAEGDKRAVVIEERVMSASQPCEPLASLGRGRPVVEALGHRVLR